MIRFSVSRQSLLRWGPIPISFAAILFAYVLQPISDRGASSTTREASIRTAFQQIPKQIGHEAVWVDLGEVPIPTSQSKMLGLDAYISRRLRRLRSDKDTTATFFLAHTPDIRYMTGHHPPRCYPASGWEHRTDATAEFTVKHRSGMNIEAVLYRFEMPGPSKTIILTVVSGFLMPVVGSTARLEEASFLASSGIRAAQGISQFQLLFEGEISTEAATSFADEIIGGIPEPVLLALCSEAVSLDQRKPGDGS